MQILRNKWFGSLVVFAAFCLAVTPARANDDGDASILALKGQQFHLKLHHLHTGESLDVVYKIGSTYVPSASRS